MYSQKRDKHAKIEFINIVHRKGIKQWKQKM